MLIHLTPATKASPSPRLFYTFTTLSLDMPSNSPSAALPLALHAWRLPRYWPQLHLRYIAGGLPFVSLTNDPETSLNHHLTHPFVVGLSPFSLMPCPVEIFS